MRISKSVPHYFTPGIASLIGFFIGILAGTIFDSQTVFIIVFLVLAVGGEISQILIHRSYERKKGETLRIVAFAKVSMSLSIAAFLFSVLSIAILIHYFENPSLLIGWAKLMSYGIIWDTGVISIVSLIFAILAIARIIKTKEQGLAWAIYSIIISGLVLFMWLEIYVPLIVVSDLS